MAGLAATYADAVKAVGADIADWAAHYDLPDRAECLPLLIANGFGSHHNHISHTAVNLLDLTQKPVSVETLFRYKQDMRGVVLITFT